MTEKIKPVAYGNTPVEFEQAIAILKSYGYKVRVEDEFERPYRFADHLVKVQRYVVIKGGQRPFLSQFYQSDMQHLGKNNIRYGEVFFACFQVLDNQVKDQRLKTVLSKPSSCNIRTSSCNKREM